MNMLRLQRKFTRVFDKMLSKQSLNAGTVTLVWDSAPAPGATMDESTYGGSGIQAEDAPALVHYVSASTVMRQGTGFQSGDAMVSFSPRTVLSSRRNLYFILRSRTKLARCATTAASSSTMRSSTSRCFIAASSMRMVDSRSASLARMAAFMSSVKRSLSALMGGARK